jgi:phosphinothricin acetyltransferase
MIYNHYVRNTYATFEVTPVPVTEMADRISAVLAGGFPFLVCVSDETVVGYSYASRWKSRCAYSSTTESTVYLDPGRTGHGLGTKLYGELIDELRAGEYHAVIGGIALPNPASVALHERVGFTKVAHFRETGHKMDRWIDVGYWELLLDDS